MYVDAQVRRNNNNNNDREVLTSGAMRSSPVGRMYGAVNVKTSTVGWC